ncbi:MAG: Ig-like domain-containing protein, partial [Verrucomicrobiales bacterium]|nr:Ig-like domain-containing protein [Verrucomicrobiales bacterium]
MKKNAHHFSCRWLAASLFFAIVTAMALPCEADVTLPDIISDDMVLQRGKNVPIWGAASPGESVTVNFAGQVKATTADGAGDWRVDLDPLTGNNTPQDLVVTGNNTVTVSDVLVGEVWLAVGQSNMSGGSTTEVIPGFRVVQDNSPWQVAAGSSVGVNAMPQNFASKLIDELGVPVGIINVAQGSTGIGAFEPTGGIFQDRLEVKAPFGVAGMIYWQGESDVGSRSYEYRLRMQQLVLSYRDVFEFPEMPFGITELAPVVTYAGGKQPTLRESQFMAAMFTPGVYHMVNNDLPPSNLNNVHPKTKAEVGLRMADWALNAVYGDTSVEFLPPVMKSVEYRGAEAVVAFDHVGAGLQTSDGGAPVHFELAGVDGVFWPAEALIEGVNQVRVTSGKVPAPVTVRHNWRDKWTANLENPAGLPAVAFRDDDWETLGEASLGYHIPLLLEFSPGANDSVMEGPDAAAATPDSVVELKFSQAMDLSTFDNIAVTDDGGGTVAGVWSGSGTEFTFTPDADLPLGGIDVHIPRSVKDTDGNNGMDRFLTFSVAARTTPVILADPVPTTDSFPVGGNYAGPTLWLEVVDPSVVWTLEQAPVGAVIDAGSGQVDINGVTAGGTMTVRATNGDGQFDEISWTLTATAAVAPDIDGTAIFTESTIAAYGYSSIQPSMISVGNPLPVWTLEEGPAGMSINAVTGIVTWDNPVSSASPATIRIRATNSAGMDEATWTLNVIESAAGISEDGLFVSTTGSDTTGNGSPARPYASVAKASAELINQGIEGYNIRPDVKYVYVAGGTYAVPTTERIDFWLGQHILGGYGPGFLIRDLASHPTVLDGADADRSDPLFKNDSEEWGRLVEGIDFHQFRSTSERTFIGGTDRATITFRDCDFQANTGTDGLFSFTNAGIGNEGGSAERFERCRFLDTSAAGDVGIIRSARGEVIMTNCIVANTTFRSGGTKAGVIHGVGADDGTVRIHNCTFYKNGGAAGSVVYFSTNKKTRSATITNCIIVSDDPAQIHLNNLANGEIRDDNALTIQNNLFQINGGTPWVDTGVSTVSDNILAGDPDFVSTDTAHADAFKINFGSDARNAGLDNAVDSRVPLSDLIGQARVGQTDIGAYEQPLPEIPAAPVIDEASLPDADLTEGLGWIGMPSLTGGYPVPTWSLDAASLSLGMVIDPVTGEISWDNPVVSATPYTVTVTATNAQGTVDMSFLLTVNPFVPVAPVINKSSVPAQETVYHTQAYTGFLPVLSEPGSPPGTWSLVSGPAGMTINPATGVVAWDPASMTGSPHTIVTLVSNAAGTDSATWTLLV